MRPLFLTLRSVWLIAVCCSACLVSAEDLRQWTSADGKYTVQAQLLDFDQQAVRLRRQDGNVVRVPIEKLSLDDHLYLTQRRAKPPAAESAARYRVPGSFSIATPEGGYQWKEMQAVESQGVKGQVLACVREGSTAGITLTVEHRPSRDDGVRVAAVKGHYHGVVQALQGAGFTNLRGKEPPITSPVPDEVSFLILAQGPDGSDRAVTKTILFKNSIYGLQAAAGTPEEAQKLVRIAKTIQEEPAQASANDAAALRERIEQMIALVESGDARAIFRELLPPDEYAALMNAPAAASTLAAFATTNAPQLLKMLRAIDVSKATWKENEVSLEFSNRPVVFTKVDGKWYLRNR